MGGPRLLVNNIRPIRINELDSCYFSCWPSACHWVLAKHNSSQTWIMFLAESFLTVGRANSAPLLVQDFLRFHSAHTTKQQKKYRKAVRWCASLIRSLFWLIRLIWIGLLDFWVDWTDLVYLIGWLNEWIQYIISCISWVQIAWVITPKSKYLTVSD